ncbi:MAG TPA: hypothetical protein VII56_16135 [Rhizomicrobium sp.]
MHRIATTTGVGRLLPKGSDGARVSFHATLWQDGNGRKHWEGDLELAEARSGQGISTVLAALGEQRTTLELDTGGEMDVVVTNFTVGSNAPIHFVVSGAIPGR